MLQNSLQMSSPLVNVFSSWNRRTLNNTIKSRVRYYDYTFAPKLMIHEVRSKATQHRSDILLQWIKYSHLILFGNLGISQTSENHGWNISHISDISQLCSIFVPAMDSFELERTAKKELRTIKWAWLCTLNIENMAHIIWDYDPSFWLHWHWLWPFIRAFALGN